VTRYATAVFFVVLAMAFSYAVRETAYSPVFQTPFFFCAIILTSWLGGFGPGLLASVLSVLLVGYRFNQPLHFGFSLYEIPKFVVFFLTGLFISWLVERQRRDEAALLRAQQELEKKVQERTVELQRTHMLLMREFAERLQAEQELQRLNRLTRATTMGVLAASIAHEINQPLAAVLTNANACLRWLAGDRPNLEEAKAAVQRIARDSQRAADVIARIRALLAKEPSAHQKRGINALVREMIPLLQGELQRRHIVLETDLAEGIPEVEIDSVQIQQLLLNLMANALDAMQEAPDRHHVLRIRTSPDGADAVRVAVSDTGVGLKPGEEEKLFDSFYTTKPEGMGLGLSISRSIVEAHGGRLEVTANPDAGVTFHFALPAWREPGR
jgi:C4-dicarboxylate-specific signal transduction histidine kinase